MKQKRVPSVWTLTALLLVVSMVFPWAAWASDVAVAVVDVTAPTGSVSLNPGGPSGPIVINMTVTGNQEGTATFKVNRDWTLSGGTFNGSNPQTFTVPPRTAQVPPTTFSTSGTVSVAAGQGAGTFTLAVSAFDITNSNQQGAKLSDGADSNYQVTVVVPSDTTPPVITPNVSGTLGNNGWYISDVTVSWSVTDPESAITWTNGCGPTTINSDTAGITLTCEATSAGGSNSQSVTIKRDATAPTISGSASPAPNGAGWNNSDVTVSFTCADSMSGVASCGPTQTLTGEGAGQSATGTAIDNAGNSNSAVVSNINIDTTPPTIAWSSDYPADGGTYYFGFVPAAPTCSASDTLSGPKSCTVSGYSSAVGSHTMIATAYDNADNKATEDRSYTVKAWTLSGFYQPVDMGGVWNTVKGGSTVPLKFEIFAATELTDVTSVKSFVANAVACPTTGMVADEIEFVTTGGTALRYDWTAGQFIQNWQTPKKPGSCYAVTMTTLDGSSLTANFKLK